jgi:hypothetical protein
MTTGAAATSRSASEYTAAATRSNITPTKNTRRPSRRPSRRAPTTRRATTLRLRCEYAQAIAYTSYVVVGGGIVKVNPQDRARAISIVEDAHRRMKRVLGANHQLTKAAEGILFNLNLKGPGPK